MLLLLLLLLYAAAVAVAAGAVVVVCKYTQPKRDERKLPSEPAHKARL
jgi:hypothetical protein